MSAWTAPGANLPSAAVAAPSPGLIASLGVRVWLEVSNTGQLFAPLLITHPPARREGETSEGIVTRMRTVAEALLLEGPSSRVPDVGACVTVSPRGQVLLHFSGTPCALRLPINGAYATSLTRLGSVLLAVGLDPLSKGASREVMDRYIREELLGERLLLGSATVVPAHDGQRGVPGRLKR